MAPRVHFVRVFRSPFLVKDIKQKLILRTTVAISNYSSLKNTISSHPTATQPTMFSFKSLFALVFVSALSAVNVDAAGNSTTCDFVMLPTSDLGVDALQGSVNFGQFSVSLYLRAGVDGDFISSFLPNSYWLDRWRGIPWHHLDCEPLNPARLRSPVAFSPILRPYFTV